ncbi:phosphopantetheine-binding protein [Vibrio ouci]|uniref:Carrier domain-containing protein n=1 Tax=Vibrio ouci TaxID=2499078 RepID=A0A4Y8WBQ9_9VIBR|nr:phosphopantetheine-binding protein [Vibrio ouci]TFH90264.1 hypothetical protein ELS82_17635 [Vibrio ouci]
MKKDIYKRIADLLENSYHIVDSDISESAVYDDLELDSLVLLELSVILNKEFQLRIQHGQLEPSMTIGESIDVMLQHKSDSV